MARRRHTPEQIIRKLREADRMLGEGKGLDEVVRHLEVTESTYHRWRNQFGGMKADDAKRLRELKREATRLKRTWPTRNWRSARCGRSAGEIGRPVEATSSRGDAPRAARDLATAGVPDRRPTPLHPAPRSSARRSRSRAQSPAAALRPGPSPLGYRGAHAVLVREGYCLNRKKVQRLWREEGLRVPPKRRKQARVAPPPRPPTAWLPPTPTTCGHWTSSSTSPPRGG